MLHLIEIELLVKGMLTAWEACIVYKYIYFYERKNILTLLVYL